MKYFEPVWGENKSSNSSNTPISDSSKPKHKVTETITIPISTPPVTTSIPETITQYLSSDDIQSTDIQKIEEVQLQIPWDSVDSTDSSTMEPIIEDVILPNVNNVIIHTSIFLFDYIYIFNTVLYLCIKWLVTDNMIICLMKIH